jgi:hypothetical protein
MAEARNHGGYIAVDANRDAQIREYMEANPIPQERSSTVIGVDGGVSARGGVGASAGVVFNDSEARLFVSGNPEVSTSGTPAAAGGLMVGRYNGDPVDFEGNSETRSVTAGDGVGGTYTSFSGMSATGGRQIEGDLLTIGAAQGVSAGYGKSQTSTITVDDALSAVVRFIDGLYDDE